MCLPVGLSAIVEALAILILAWQSLLQAFGIFYRENAFIYFDIVKCSHRFRSKVRGPVFYISFLSFSTDECDVAESTEKVENLAYLEILNSLKG